MATFKICVFKHQKRSDDKWPVSIRVCWRRKYAYIKTEFYITAKQINQKTFDLKDSFIIRELDRRIAFFEDIKSKRLGFKINMYTAKELAEYLENELKCGGEIDFVTYGRELADRLESKGRKSTADTYRRTLNGLVDFCNGRNKIMITEITVSFLRSFAEYLQSRRKITRMNQFGRPVTVIHEPASDNTVGAYMTDIRTIFNAAIMEFNDEERGNIRIQHYPFKKFKIVRTLSDKRNLTPDQINKIRRIQDDQVSGRAELARDVFMMSFYLCGMNMADLYDCDPIFGGRINYKRQKTRSRRQDEAFISIRVEPECLPLVEKYADPEGLKAFNFYHRYSDRKTFEQGVNKGLKQIAAMIRIDEDLSTYYARHSWATIARNKAGISKDDIDLALNHVDMNAKMADVYIAKDWSLVDNANRAVLNYLNIVPVPNISQSQETPKSAQINANASMSTTLYRTEQDPDE